MCLICRNEPLEGLLVLNCSNCKEVESLPALPEGLKKLECYGCTSLTNLPKLPESLDFSKALETNVLGADATNDSTDPEIYTLGFDLQSAEKADMEDIYSTEYHENSENTQPVSRVAGNINTDPTPIIEEDDPLLKNLLNESSSVNVVDPAHVSDFEEDNFVALSKSVLLRDEQIKSAGFTNAFLEDEAYDGSLYKTIYTDDLYDVDVKKIVIKTTDTLLAKVYIIKIGANSPLDKVYQVLKVRGSEGLDVEINETNEYGDSSFYINDTRRPNTAFLTVKVGDFIYGFSYPKEYHAQIKNLIQLLMWENK